ncbi:MAG: GntR family transcriptional regulator [Clostridia bacterium]|nr:GntR family transcriptional regulator [Clostridia bacterium]
MASMDLPDNEKGRGLRSRVFRELEHNIITGKYPPGMALTEKQLCLELGVSRTPLREALSQLELEGLVQSTPNKGAVVLGISSQDIDDIYTIKLELEGLAAKLAAERIKPEELTELEEVVSMTEFYMGKGNVDKVVELDSRFHDIICKASKNRPLRDMMSNYHNFVKLARHKSLTKPERIPMMLTEHRKIMHAIAKGDGELASQLAVEHISKARVSIAKVLHEK